MAAERAAEATMAAEREAAAREAAVRAVAEAETVGTCSVRHSRRSPCRRRTEPLRRTEQSGSLRHRPGTRCYWRTCTYWCTTSAAARAAAARAAAARVAEALRAVVKAAARAWRVGRVTGRVAPGKMRLFLRRR